MARGIDGLRAAYERFLTTNFPPSSSTEKIEEGDVNGYWVEALRRSSGRVILHFHGGGYVMGSAKGSLELAGRLADAIQGRCFTADYRLAPEEPYPAALNDAVAAYQWLLAQGIDASDILVSGKSSGGEL